MLNMDISELNRDFTMLCEHDVNPLCIQKTNPLFSWRFENLHGRQLGYRIIVSENRELVEKGIGDCWDSGEVESHQSTGIVYHGAPLQSRKRYYWRVFLRLESFEGGYAGKTAFFETAIFTDEEWSARWIEARGLGHGISRLFRKEFTVKSRPEKAVAYISGLGYNYFYINGKKVGDRCLEPGWTDYRRRVLYSVYDVTDYIVEGANAMAAELGEGWYGHTHESLVKNAGSNPVWHSAPKLLLELELYYTDGSRERIASGKNRGFLCAAGAVTENGIYDGETYDSARAVPEWNKNAEQPKGFWAPAAAAKAPGGKLVAQAMPPIRITQELKPVASGSFEDGTVVYDFGQNIAGWAELRCAGPRGSSVEMLYAENLDENGRTDRRNLRGAKSRDKYILSGDSSAPEIYQPIFTYHGFRFVEARPSGGAKVLGAAGMAAHTDVRRTSYFECDCGILNKIYNAVIWSERNNMHSVPTDCPQRDERMAWLNDMTVRCEEAVFNFDLFLFYEKWLGDIADAQAENGAIPDTVPFIYGNCPAFHISSSFVLTPWYVYVYYGDESLISEFYPNLRRYMDFLCSQRDEQGIIGEQYCGDWAPPASECRVTDGSDAIPKNVPNGIITTGYLYFDCLVMRKMADLLGLEKDVAFFGKTALEIGRAINSKYLNKNGFYGTNSQGSNIFPLFLGLPGDMSGKVLDNLLKDIAKHDFHITTGNQMTKYLFEVLDMAGQNEAALKIAGNTTYPSLGYMLENGATTIWERWEKLCGGGMNSHDHPMNAAYTIWLFKSLGGYRFDKRPGNLEEVLLEPDTGVSLNRVQTEYSSVKGRFRSSWKKENGSLKVYVSIPWNTGAVLKLKSKNGYRKIFCEKNRLYESGKTGKAPGVKEITVERGTAAFALESGEYRFTLYE